MTILKVHTPDSPKYYTWFLPAILQSKVCTFWGVKQPLIPFLHWNLDSPNLPETFLTKNSSRFLNLFIFKKRYFSSLQVWIWSFLHWFDFSIGNHWFSSVKWNADFLMDQKRQKKLFSLTHLKPQLLFPAAFYLEGSSLRFIMKFVLYIGIGVSIGQKCYFFRQPR